MNEEIQKALKNQKTDTAPGPDGIRVSNEFIIVNKNHLIPTIRHLFNAVLHSEIVPHRWTMSSIILLHKKRDENNINNYRSIGLSSNIYKLFAKIILKRTNTLDHNQSKELAGFRGGYSTLPHTTPHSCYQTAIRERQRIQHNFLLLLCRLQ